MFYRSILLLFVLLGFLNANGEVLQIKSFKAKFNQSIKSINNNLINYEGEVFIRDDGKILWKYSSPIIKNVYILNDLAIVDEPELEQAIITTLEDEINIIKLLKDSKELKKDSFLSTIDDVDYLISVENSLIKNISYKDKLENDVSISFFEVTQNTQLEDEIFKFEIPKHYDIIRK